MHYGCCARRAPALESTLFPSGPAVAGSATNIDSKPIWIPLIRYRSTLEPRAHSAISGAGAKVSAAVSPRDKMAIDERNGCCGINTPLYIFKNCKTSDLAIEPLEKVSSKLSFTFEATHVIRAWNHRTLLNLSSRSIMCPQEKG